MTALTTIDADVAIVGGGVCGCAIARRLSMQKVRVVVLERRHDVCCGASGANSGITGSGWSLARGSIEARLTVASNPRWEEIADQLALTYRRCGSLILARREEEVGEIPAMMAQAESNGVEVRQVGPDEARRMAPHADPQVYGAMLIPCEGVIDTPRVTFAYAELAALNGVKFFCSEPLLEARRRGEQGWELFTPHLKVSAGYVVNAAGLGGDVVSRILGCEEFEMTARRGEYLVFDREVGREATCILQMIPTPLTHGLMIIPTAHGGLLVGPTADDIPDKLDTATHAQVLEQVLADGRTLMPSLEERYVIKTYAGNRPHSEDGLYRIGPSEAAPNVIQVAAIRSIGVSASPALSDHVFELLCEQGLSAPARRDARERLERPRRLFDTMDFDAAAGEPLGRTVVCACEKVTAADIHAALQSPVPARSIAGIARRTHATYGRCQGSACGSGVAFIASVYRQGKAWELPVGEPEATLGVGEASHV
jgi:glycerol-3-phosphate dehydrogenase